MERNACPNPRIKSLIDYAISHNTFEESLMEKAGYPMLKLGKREKIYYTIRQDGEVVLTPATAPEGNDPVLGQLLNFLANDIAHRPEHLQSVDVGLITRIQSLVGHVEIDLDAPLSTDDG